MTGFSKRALGLMRALLLPLLVLTLTQVAIRTVARYCGEAPGRNRTWVHWDAYRYIDVARHGYVEASWDPLASNTGWFPGYPLALRFVSEASSLGMAGAGRLVSGLFLLGFLVVLDTALLTATRWPHRLVALLTAGFFPGWMYFHAVFPQSMAVFFTLAALALAARRKWLLAGVCGAVAAFTYPTGVVVIVPLALLVVRESREGVRDRALALVQAPGVAALGLAAVAALHQAQVGHWDAYMRFQGHLGAGLFNPLAVQLEHLRPLLRLEASAEGLIALHTAVTCLLLLTAVATWWRKRESMRPVDAAFLLYAAVLWVFVNAAGPNLSIYRQAAALVCLVPILARLPLAAGLGLLAVLVPLGLKMATLFFQDVLV